MRKPSAMPSLREKEKKGEEGATLTCGEKKRKGKSPACLAPSNRPSMSERGRRGQEKKRRRFAHPPSHQPPEKKRSLTLVTHRHMPITFAGGR